MIKKKKTHTHTSDTSQRIKKDYICIYFHFGQTDDCRLYWSASVLVLE